MIEFPLGMSLGRPYSFHLIFLRLKIANKKSRTRKNQVRLYTKCPALVVVVRTYFLHIKFTICDLRSKYVSCVNIVQI